MIFIKYGHVHIKSVRNQGTFPAPSFNNGFKSLCQTKPSSVPLKMKAVALNCATNSVNLTILSRYDKGIVLSTSFGLISTGWHSRKRPLRQVLANKAKSAGTSNCAKMLPSSLRVASFVLNLVQMSLMHVKNLVIAILSVAFLMFWKNQ